MYIPKPFSADETRAFDLMEAWGFATLVTVDNGGGIATTRLPFLVDRDKRALTGHMARGNPQWRGLDDATDLRVLFNGVDGYISPSWYADPGLVPTWNYEAVDVTGRAELVTGVDDTRAIVDDLSARHESGLANPWSSDKMEPARLKAMLGAIQGFRIRVDSIAVKSKLSQNRSDADRAGAIQGLRREGQGPLDLMLAEEMERAKRIELSS